MSSILAPEPTSPEPISPEPPSPAPQGPPSPPKARHPFQIRNFRFFWPARLAAMTSWNILVIVMGWQVYELARATLPPNAAALQLGLLGLAQFAPIFLLTPITGWAADRFDRRLIALLTSTLNLFSAASLAILTALHLASPAHLMAIAALMGVARAFAAPALNALGPSLVPPEVLPRAIAISAIAGRVASIVGPAAGGYLYAIWPSAPYLVSVGLLAASLVAMAFVRHVRTPIAPRRPWLLMLEGLHYIRGHTLVLGAISLDLFAVLLGGATAMLPIFARDVLHVGPEGLGHLRAAPAVGALVTAGLFSWRPLKHHVGIKLLLSVATFGAATIVFGLSRSMPLSLACLVVVGAADMLSVYVRQTLIQLSTPDAMRGRVGAVSSLFISASNELGEAESGFLAALVGPVAAVVAGGVGAILITGLWAWWFPSLRRAASFSAHPDQA